jgi:hypothetical protein
LEINAAGTDGNTAFAETQLTWAAHLSGGRRCMLFAKLKFNLGAKTNAGHLHDPKFPMTTARTGPNETTYSVAVQPNSTDPHLTYVTKGFFIVPDNETGPVLHQRNALDYRAM